MYWKSEDADLCELAKMVWSSRTSFLITLLPVLAIEARIQSFYGTFQDTRKRPFDRALTISPAHRRGKMSRFEHILDEASFQRIADRWGRKPVKGDKPWTFAQTQKLNIREITYAGYLGETIGGMQCSHCKADRNGAALSQKRTCS